MVLNTFEAAHFITGWQNHTQRFYMVTKEAKADVSAHMQAGPTLGRPKQCFIAPSPPPRNYLLCIKHLLSLFQFTILQNSCRLQWFYINFGKAFELSEKEHTGKLITKEINA